MTLFYGMEVPPGFCNSVLQLPGRGFGFAQLDRTDISATTWENTTMADVPLPPIRQSSLNFMPRHGMAVISLMPQPIPTCNTADRMADVACNAALYAPQRPATIQ